jgi:hypothetical protein
MGAGTTLAVRRYGLAEVLGFCKRRPGERVQRGRGGRQHPFVSSLICAANQKPEYNRDIRVAMKIYAHYGDSRWRGIKNLWWRF